MTQDIHEFKSPYDPIGDCKNQQQMDDTNDFFNQFWNK